MTIKINKKIHKMKVSISIVALLLSAALLVQSCSENVKKPEEKVERAISVEASNSLLSAAEGIENPAIKEALEKLAGK